MSLRLALRCHGAPRWPLWEAASLAHAYSLYLLSLLAQFLGLPFYLRLFAKMPFHLHLTLFVTALKTFQVALSHFYSNLVQSFALLHWHSLRASESGVTPACPKSDHPSQALGFSSSE